MDTLIVDKLRKIEKLANCGVDGERKNAARMLRDLLFQHGLTLEDLSEENEKEYLINYRTTWEKKLLLQIYAKITGSSRIRYSKLKGKTGMFFKLGVTQYIDFMAMYDAYRPALKKEMETLFMAFVSKHNISAPPNEDSKKTQCSTEETERIWQMVMGLRDVVVSNKTKLIEGNRA